MGGGETCDFIEVKLKMCTRKQNISQVHYGRQRETEKVPDTKEQQSPGKVRPLVKNKLNRLEVCCYDLNIEVGHSFRKGRNSGK